MLPCCNVDKDTSQSHDEEAPRRSPRVTAGGCGGLSCLTPYAKGATVGVGGDAMMAGLENLEDVPRLMVPHQRAIAGIGGDVVLVGKRCMAVTSYDPAPKGNCGRRRRWLGNMRDRYRGTPLENTEGSMKDRCGNAKEQCFDTKL